jgi:hypothetical protein
MEVGSVLAGVIGVAGTLVGKKVTERVAGFDAAIVRFVKPFQPAIALGLSWVLPKACAGLGLVSVCPSPDALTGAPIGVIGGIVVLEAAKRLGVVK